jgi:hypothetical protein
MKRRKCSTRLRAERDKPPAFFTRPEAFSAEGGFWDLESG